MNEKGSALLACIAMSLLLASLVVWTSSWTWERTRVDVDQLAALRARQYAESGISAAGPWLRRPSLGAELPPGTTAGFTIDSPNGQTYVGLDRRFDDTSLVDVYATGYFHIQKGDTVDPATLMRAKASCINAKFRISNVADYLIAVPNDLTVGYGTQATSGTIYAQNLIFLDGAGPDPTRVKTAYYFNSVSPDLSFVEFTGPTLGPVKLSHRPSFAALDPKMREFYAERAGGAVTPPMSGLVSEPASHVYFVDGDLNIADLGPLIVQGVYVVYATGNVRIYNDILPNPNSWVAILSEKNMYLADTADTDDLALTGTFVCNGTFFAEGSHPPTGSLTINGGFVTMGKPDFSTAYQIRTYAYGTSTNENLLLPNMTNILEFTVLSGRGGLN